MNEKQIRERIINLKREVAILEEIVDTRAEGIGRPQGSVTYTEEQVKFLKENKSLPPTMLAQMFNKKFKYNLPLHTRKLYKIMRREGIIPYRTRK